MAKMKAAVAPTGDIMASGAMMSPRKAIASGMGPGAGNFGCSSFETGAQKCISQPKTAGKGRGYNPPI